MTVALHHTLEEIQRGHTIPSFEGEDLTHLTFVNTIRRHHTAHHDQGLMMERNINLTFPIADWMFGTSDLDRGMLGHVFNGYSTKYLKSNLRKVSRTPKRAKVRPAAGATA